MRPTNWLHAIALALAVTLSSTSVGAAPGPRATLMAINVNLAAALALDDQQALRQRMRDGVALDVVCRRLLGQNWAASTAPQREVLRNHVLSLIVNAYASAMENALIEEVRYETLKQSANSAVITADIPTAKGHQNQVRFRLTSRNDHWLVNDVMVEGISLVTVFRASFKSIVEKEGIDGLIAHLNKRYATASS